ncbi:hypothetical protein HDA40_001918 [Hamadaea flava]|uniref:Uncharacterized protein n=1 Tax=Hamadaea flava TaxID=1742688 RepID=A0ABV8LEA5_9ACTN|nr:hypothetical protein [Hamadaea flava]MCP2323411.1 hypothetical protein [Hamadaea flava]
MLKPAWYLADLDFYGETRAVPTPAFLPGGLPELLSGDEQPLTPARVIQSLRIAVAAVEHVHDATGHTVQLLRKPEDTRRVLLGVNLLAAHLAQLLPGLADHVDRQLPENHGRPAGPELRQAAAMAEQVAAHASEAELALRAVEERQR